MHTQPKIRRAWARYCARKDAAKELILHPRVETSKALEFCASVLTGRGSDRTWWVDTLNEIGYYVWSDNNYSTRRCHPLWLEIDLTSPEEEAFEKLVHIFRGDVYSMDDIDFMNVIDD